ncbi:acyl carrier protein [Streptomyces sp. CoH27]|uniref:acyl carrier protein n=1 Tax=Streptomyces sp. CoH27 TaxID=2875763 RepID=UPI001CD7ACBB|nr:acyl carrier protein [Streptomyces sp. CoH27]
MTYLDDAQALSVVKESITRIAPDADFASVGPDDRLRDVFDLDSLDFLSLVEVLSERTGIRIDEADFPDLATLAGATRFLVDRSRTGAGRRP